MPAPMSAILMVCLKARLTRAATAAPLVIRGISMKQTEKEWRDWLLQMEQILALELDESRRAELLAQFRRIADMAEPLMAYPLDQRLEIAGVYKA